MNTQLSILPNLNSVRVFFLFFCMLFINTASSQYDNLIKLEGFESSVYYSAGHDQRAKDITIRTEKAINYNYKLLGFKPQVTLLILTPEDWSKHTTFPVYGMAHYKDDQTLVVATSDNDLWRSFIPPVDQLPTPLAEQIKKEYGTKDGSLSMQPFFDLLALHELGHAFHIQGGLTMQRKWMGELFCNILLHTYIAENEPEQLNALTLFPEMVVAAGTTGYKFTSLNQFENNYSELGQKHPKNYGWYQCRYHKAAKDIYEAGGPNILKRLWNTLKEPKDQLTDAELAAILAKNVHQNVANILLKWNTSIQ